MREYINRPFIPEQKSYWATRFCSIFECLHYHISLEESPRKLEHFPNWSCCCHRCASGTAYTLLRSVSVPKSKELMSAFRSKRTVSVNFLRANFWILVTKTYHPLRNAVTTSSTMCLSDALNPNNGRASYFTSRLKRFGLSLKPS